MSELTANEQTTLKIMQWEYQGMEDGCKKYSTYPTNDFWNLWRYKKDQLKSEGIAVTKIGPAFVVSKFEHQSNVGEKFKGKLIKAIMYPDLLKGKQKQHVIDLCNALINHGAALDASITGAGKTYCARSVAKELGVDVFVVCPHSALSMWRRVTEEIGVGAIVINWEKLRTFKTEYLQKVDTTKQSNSQNAKGKTQYDNSDNLQWSIPKDMLIIYDEVHRAKNYKTYTSDIILAATKQNYDTLLLSATLADSPLNMQITGFALRLFSTLKGFWPWAFRHGVSKGTNDAGYTIMKFTDSDPTHLQKINKALFPSRGGRLTKKDLPELFTDTFIIAEAYDMKSAKKIQAMYDTFGEGLGDYVKQRMFIELHKVDTFVQLAKDGLEEGNSVLIFVNFKETIYELMRLLDTDCVVHGDQKTKKARQQREDNIQSFQENESKLIILTTPAGSESISLHDVIGDSPRLSLISPTNDSVALKQVFGRPDRAGGKSNSVQKIIYAADTVEEEIAYRVRKKLKNLSLLNDGDLIETYSMEKGSGK